MDGVAVAVQILIVLIVLLGVGELEEELEELDLVHELGLRKVVLNVLEDREGVRLTVEESDLGKFLEEYDRLLLLYQLRIVLKLIVKLVHMAKVRHRLLKFPVLFDGQDLNDWPLPVIRIPHDPIVERPYLQMHRELNLTLSINLQRLDFHRALFRSVHLHL